MYLFAEKLNLVHCIFFERKSENSKYLTKKKNVIYVCEEKFVRGEVNDFRGKLMLRIINNHSGIIGNYLWLCNRALETRKPWQVLTCDQTDPINMNKAAIHAVRRDITNSLLI